MTVEWEVEVYKDGKRSEMLKVAAYEYNKADVNYSLRRIDLATCPGRHCSCPNCRHMRRDAEMAAKAPLGKRFDEGPTFVAVVLAGHKQIKVLGLFQTLLGAVAYVKANCGPCEPLGKTRFMRPNGEVLIVQEHVHILAMEEV